MKLIRMRKVSTLCVCRRPDWKCNKARDLGNGYKLYYSGAIAEERNGVVSQKIKYIVTELRRGRDLIITVRLPHGECTIKCICTTNIR